LHQRDKGNTTSRKRKLAKNQFDATAAEAVQRPHREIPAPIGEILAGRRANGRIEAPPEVVGSDSRPLPTESGLESHPPRRRGRPPKTTEQIAALVEQFSGEFHDEEHVKPNISQAARLWKASGLSEDAFCHRLYEAASITKRYDVQKRADGEAGKWGMRNKMPYYFTVLRDVLGMRDDQDSRSPTASP
jgi:hypothetical protein